MKKNKKTKLVTCLIKASGLTSFLDSSIYDLFISRYQVRVFMQIYILGTIQTRPVQEKENPKSKKNTKYKNYTVNIKSINQSNF